MIWFRRWYRLYQEGRRVHDLLVQEMEEAERERASTARYRAAWLSARRRADNAQGSVVFWKQTAAGLQHSVKKLAQWLEEEQQQRKTSMGNLVLPPPAVDALGSHDRRNALWLTDENERLRHANEDLRELNRRLTADLDAAERQLKEGNPS